jgi:hypothetical protein
MLLSLAMLVVLIACFLLMSALVLFCDSVIDVSLPHVVGYDPHDHRLGAPADEAAKPNRGR